MSRRDLEKQIEELQADHGGGDEDRQSVTIRNVSVDADGEIRGVFKTVRTWRDADGEWHSEAEEHDYADLDDVDDERPR